MLADGTRLGPFEIVAPLGAGGMGEVYRARDTNLHRDVAIKILPDAFAADAERLARFEREARVLAALSHPGIAAIYGLERTPTAIVLVMELAAGDARGPHRPRSVSCRRGGRDRHTDRGGPRSRARERDHPSRSEAGERRRVG